MADSGRPDQTFFLVPQYRNPWIFKNSMFLSNVWQNNSEQKMVWKTLESNHVSRVQMFKDARSKVLHNCYPHLFGNVLKCEFVLKCACTTRHVSFIVLELYELIPGWPPPKKRPIKEI